MVANFLFRVSGLAMFSASIGRVGLKRQHIVINHRAGLPPPITTSTTTGIFVEDQPGACFIIYERKARVKL